MTTSNAVQALSRSGAELLTSANALGRRFAEQAALRDSERRLPHAEMAQLSESGIFAARVPAAFGGPEVGILELAQIFIRIARGDPNIAQAMQPHACGVEKIRLYGSPQQQAHFFGLINGGALITNASAEKGGKFVGDLRTTIKRDGHQWRLSGTKSYSTGSLFAQYLYVLAINEQGGKSIAIVPIDRVGISVADDWDGMGQRTTASGTVVFDNVTVSDEEYFLITESVARRTHEGALAQILHAAIDTGIALAALEDAALYGRTKARPLPEANVERASDDPFIQHAVGEMAVLAHGAEAMVERSARILDEVVLDFWADRASERKLGMASVAVAEAKMAANDASLRVSEMLYRVGGAGATVRPLNLDRHWRNARTHTTHDPVAYKAKAIGEFYLNDQLPPINTKI